MMFGLVSDSQYLTIIFLKNLLETPIVDKYSVIVWIMEDNFFILCDLQLSLDQTFDFLFSFFYDVCLF